VFYSRPFILSQGNEEKGTKKGAFNQIESQHKPDTKQLSCDDSY